MVVLMLTGKGFAVSVNWAERDEARQWVSAKFEGAVEKQNPAGGIQVVENHDPVQPNSRSGKSMRVPPKEYTRGLYCHAPSHLVVRLPGPATQFEAIVGIDSNDQTSGGRGSVIFSVEAGGKSVWSSGVMREGMPGVAAEADLAGATEISLRVGDAGDGISCDQSDWADAKVTLEDGQEVWLGDLPIEGMGRAPYTADPPFSFTYGGRVSRELLPSWNIDRTARQIDDKTLDRTLTYSDPATGLVVRCSGIEYHDFPTIEWTLFFKNTGSADTPILSNIKAVDTRFERSQGGEFVLRHHTGDLCTADSFEPHEEVLRPKADKHIANSGGRPTQRAFPYFNLEFSGHEGVIAVVSWAGQWASQFTRDEGNGLQFAAGQELTHFVLKPGEEIRSPMIVLQFWTGDWLHAQNVWRQWMIAHNIPRPGGKLPPLPLLLACSSHQFGEMINANKDNQIFFIDHYLERGLKLDYWWMDAGWYLNQTGWPNTGTWEVDTNRFPGGLRAITDHAHAKGLKSIVWFEPERVTPGTWLYENHPEWLLGKDGEQKLLNLGDPAAREWLTNHVDGLLTSQGIDLYRQDFNMDPLPYWRANDTEDRQGITEIRHVMGYQAYWDELRRRHPDMLIDSCASGGRRNDLETLRRAVPLLRSDYIMEPVGNQCHTYALSFWYPFYGTGSSQTDTYRILSVLCPNFIACWDMRRDDLDYENFRRIIDRWKGFGPAYFGDYYPLTPYSLSEDQWIAWQFNRSDTGSGLVQAFRRSESLYEAVRLPLKGLEEKGRYHLVGTDGESQAEMTGAQLMEAGLPIRLIDKPAGAIVTYQKVP
jgi:alpha-galactosidase